ncbi:ABC transporter permease subunit [Streptomyces sp. NPDC049040]|uniref:ABC transporter permease subunit n=1 Tax=Streptomyces sp. NPDC049040 TaxID=3365593 RepID=UPI00371CDCCB
MTSLTVGPRWLVRRLGSQRLRGLGWVTWRQHRMALAGCLALLGGFGVLMVVNGLEMRGSCHRLGLEGCGSLGGRSCSGALSVFERQYQGWALFLPRILAFAPGLLGTFVGAPLIARELESGTFRFAWTQGRSRVAWALAKIAILGATLTAAALGFSLLFTWWFHPWEPVLGRMGSGQAYEISGVVFAARTLFAFALGALLGTLIRRTVPAMAATAALWTGVVWSSVLWLRPLIQAPLDVPTGSTLITSRGWTVTSWVQDPAGHRYGVKSDELIGLFQRARTDGVNSDGAFDTWLAGHGYTQWSSYQPGNRFWHFQSIEASTYSILAVLLMAATLWWLNRSAV